MRSEFKEKIKKENLDYFEEIKDEIFKKINHLPAEAREEAEHFIDFLLFKYGVKHWFKIN